MVNDKGGSTMYACMRDDGLGDWMMDDENWIS
jgi:hypothetical protein